MIPRPGRLTDLETMQADIDYDTLDDALRRSGASWGAAQAHGLLAGRLAVMGSDSGPGWLRDVLDGTDPANALRREAEELLGSLFDETHRQLAQRQSEFSPLLPDDADAPSVRAAGLAHWCEGFLHGLVSGDYGEPVREQLAKEPLADIIKDMLEITRAAADDDSDDDSDESAYAELVEYLRVAAQLAYEELAEQRAGGGEAAPKSLH